MATEAEMRAALAWETDQRPPDEKNTLQWLWEALQGDFNDNRSTGQIAFDAAVSIIPVVDQICDVRDIIANCRAIATAEEQDDNSWKWVALVLTLIGLFPSLGSIVKGVLKIFFVFMRRYGLDTLLKASDDAMTWVVTFLRKREVQRLLRELKVDEVFRWLSDQVRAVKGQVSEGAILAAFDRGIGVMKGLLDQVLWMPEIGARARATIQMVETVRRQADRHIANALAPVQRMLDAIIRRLDIESLVQRSGILDARNVHFRGTLPEAQAVALMRRADPLPPWLSRGRVGRYPGLDPAQTLPAVSAQVQRGWPSLTEGNIASFHRLAPDTIVGPAKLYRVVSPTNGAMGDCWISEDVFYRLTQTPDPKAAWRKHLAVWPDWNPNGQLVVFDVPAGQTLKVWRGPTSSQVKKDLDANLEGGWEQIVFSPDRHNNAQWDETRIYQRSGTGGGIVPSTLSADDYRRLPLDRRNAYLPVRERIRDPRIQGPYNTGWGSTDFDPQLNDARIGLPALPGQVTNTAK